ncbi:MAG TPA: multicopper oxidase domain-containing protein, partial [Gemmatimonadaceae bacterium]|nr:multicopper oxidase domain-containing protein [Gemmatimonadaceae bacterium]
RVINASADSHPMHLHGFYYMVDSRGDGGADTTFDTVRRRRANTEDLLPGTTMTLTWVPERAGNWLFHCHLPDHFSARGPMGTLPTPSMVASMRGHGSMNHALHGMGGLVLGIVVHPGHGSAATPIAKEAPPSRVLRLLIRRNAGDTESRPFYSFALAKDGVEPPPDTGLRVGPPIVVTRGEPVRITVVNTLDVPTAVHWHGIELDSYYDGIAGFSGAGNHIAPVIAAADSFIVRFTPPRAGTFIYHTHVDETRQQLAGLAGPLIVLEPGQVLDSTRDHSFIIGTPLAFADELHSVLINGSAAPAPLTVRAGVPQRLRFINVTLRRPGARIEVWRDTTMLQWRPLAKDGADVPAAWQVARPARTSISIGETLDYEIVLPSGGNTRLEFHGRDGSLLATLPLTVMAGP